MAAMNKLKLDIKWDNGRVTSLGSLTYEQVRMIEDLVREAFNGNAVEMHINGGMSMSYPERHSGEYLMVDETAAMDIKERQTSYTTHKDPYGRDVAPTPKVIVAKAVGRKKAIGK